MNDCPVDHPALPGLFDLQIPNNPALWAVFLGRHSGQAVVDDLSRPSRCMLRTDAVMTYASRQMTAIFLEDALQYFTEIGPTWLIRNPGAPPAPKPKRILSRLEFFDLDPSSETLRAYRQRLEPGFTLRLVDRDLIQRCEWREDMEFFSGSLDNFFRQDLGICLMRGDEIIVEAYSSAFGGRYAEIGAITHQPYRCKGFATLTVAFLIEMLNQRGYQPYWSCDVDNPASAQVARKLGFKVEKPYEIWEYLQEE
jgi:RimJ/RimL family protein N-acetyltransferase